MHPLVVRNDTMYSESDISCVVPSAMKLANSLRLDHIGGNAAPVVRPRAGLRQVLRRGKPVVVRTKVRRARST